MSLGPLLDQIGQLPAVGNDGELTLRRHARQRAAESGVRRIEDHDVGDIERCIHVVDDFEGGGIDADVIGNRHPLRPERPHVQRGRRDDGAAIENKQHGTRRCASLSFSDMGRRHQARDRLAGSVRDVERLHDGLVLHPACRQTFLCAE